jgi:hypothetical protein
MLQFLKRVFRKQAGQVARAAPARPTLEGLERREVLSAALPGALSAGALSSGVREARVSDAGAIIINSQVTAEATSYRLAPGGSTVAGWSPDGRQVIAVTAPAAQRGNAVAGWSPDGDRTGAAALKQRAAVIDYFWPADDATRGGNPFASFSPDGHRPAEATISGERKLDLFWPGSPVAFVDGHSFVDGHAATEATLKQQPLQDLNVVVPWWY